MTLGVGGSLEVLRGVGVGGYRPLPTQFWVRKSIFPTPPPAPHAKKKKKIKKSSTLVLASLKVGRARPPGVPKPGGGHAHAAIPTLAPPVPIPAPPPEPPAPFSGDAEMLEMLAVPHLIEPCVILNGSNFTICLIWPVTADSGI